MTYTIDIKPLTKSLTDEQFAQLCAKNPELKFEINSKGELLHCLSKTLQLAPIQIFGKGE
ncbi:MAG: hypothetical protein QNJ65_14055 [Xenococcaceae cyanobacterium MO_234.B1]|nr:hypothetical protein [Xenococcaceae cyanobacterium MO_234.B1]